LSAAFCLSKLCGCCMECLVQVLIQQTRLDSSNKPYLVPTSVGLRI